MSAPMHPSRRNLLVAGGASLAGRALGQGPSSTPRAKRVIWLQMAGQTLYADLVFP